MIIDNTGIEGFPQRLNSLIEKDVNNAPKIAEIIGVKRAAMYKLSNSSGSFSLTIPSSENLLKLAAYFEVSPYWLLFGTEYETNFQKSVTDKSDTQELLEAKDFEIESLKKEVAKYKRIYDTCERKVTDLFKDFENLKESL